MISASKRTLWMIAALLVLFAALGEVQAKPIEVKGKIEAVTVYRGQALVTRLIEVKVPAGAAELIVKDLPEKIVTTSLYASGDNGMQVRAVQYRARAVKDEPRTEVRRLDEQIADAKKELRKAEYYHYFTMEHISYLRGLATFTSEKVKVEMNKGTLDPKAVEAISNYIFTTRKPLAEKDWPEGQAVYEMKENIALLERQREKLVAGRAKGRTAREAVIFLDVPKGGKQSLRLNYLVEGAGWSPTYNARSAGPDQPVSLEYNALVQQMSGESWESVKLTLSTASPSMAADAPTLAPLWMTLTSSQRQAVQSVEKYAKQQRAYKSSRAQKLRTRGRSIRPSAQPQAQIEMEGDWALNAMANREQLMDLVTRRDVLLAGRKLLADDTVLSVSYPLSGEVSVPSRRDQQMIQIARMKLAGEFHYLASPVLTPYVYRQVNIVNTGEFALLPGPINSYVDGQFVGVGTIPMVAKGQRFAVGFGADSQLRVIRELTDKTDRIRGGNRELTFKYRVLVYNYKDTPVKVRLLDRLPDPKNADIRVTLLETSEPISEDPIYLRTLRKSGILRWQLDVPAKSTGEKAKTVEYSFNIEFDRKMQLTAPAAAELEKRKADFSDKLRMLRQSR